jgi:energy-coupling factor transport system permease protein
MHPGCQIISLICALSYNLYLKGKKALKFNFVFLLPLFLVYAVINPAFSHEGATILAYLPSGNPLTLESIAYGISSSLMICTVIIWFSSYNVIMTADKFVYLFGRVIPAMSLILSMTLRLIPKFKAQIKVVSDAQKCVGRDVSNGGLIQRAKNGVTIISIMVSWALENAIETADSMKSRGYGLPGRTAFSIYRFDNRDRMALFAILACSSYILLGAALDGMKWRYYPTMKGADLNAYTLSLYACYFILCITPLYLNVREDRKWNALKSAA